MFLARVFVLRKFLSIYACTADGTDSQVFTVYPGSHVYLPFGRPAPKGLNSRFHLERNTSGIISRKLRRRTHRARSATVPYCHCFHSSKYLFWTHLQPPPRSISPTRTYIHTSSSLLLGSRILSSTCLLSRLYNFSTSRPAMRNLDQI